MCNYSILFTGLGQMAAESGVCSRGKSRDRRGEPAYAGSFDFQLAMRHPGPHCFVTNSISMTPGCQCAFSQPCN